MQQKYLLNWISSDFFSKRASTTYKISRQDIETEANKEHAGILVFLWCIWQGSFLSLKWVYPMQSILCYQRRWAFGDVHSSLFSASVLQRKFICLALVRGKR